MPEPAAVPPTPDPATVPADLGRAVARQHGARRRVAAAAVAVVAAVVTAACGTAAASTPDEDAQSLVRQSQLGHSGHGSAAAGQEDQQGGSPGEDSPQEGDRQGGDDQDGDEQGGDRQDGDEQGGDRQDGDEQDGDQPDGGEPNNGLDVIGRDCATSDLPEHTGFQESPACVDTAFGEVAAADKSPSLLITDAPREVTAGQPFTLKVSTRNLVRDRFLGAAAGGYYLESSFLDDEGVQRGHFHTACRMLPDLDEAPDAEPAPAFFLATQDNKGGSGVDTVDVVVTGLPEKGTAQCTSWAGDGSHRIPMMTRANQTPAVDSVRITVQ